ncbi:hypothetical protein ACFONG_11545 [Uliginosibacterium paludis]|uniref:Response regulator n=1 Tax=Uliginosibacterium paludis TaxID=1615952 RepID=A0ABV2CLW0_9RHOO
MTAAQPVTPSESGVPALLVEDDAALELLLDLLELLAAEDVLLALLAEEPLPVLVVLLSELPPPPPPHAVKSPAVSRRLTIPIFFVATIGAAPSV